MQILSERTASLGDSTYVLVHGGAAVVVDPQRDVARFERLAADAGATITHVVETHVHNDYVSGGRDLARRAGADLVLPAGCGAGFAFVPAFHQEELDIGAGAVLRPLHTPGHTPEHVSYLVVVEGEAVAVFTGGSLLVGAAGRTDLLGDEFARQLAVLQFGSLQRLAALPGDVGVYPTHGEGSFCTSSGAGRTTSTVATELAENPVLSFDDPEAFAEAQLAGLVPYPSYYAYMAPINRRGPDAMPASQPAELTATEFARQLPGATVIDGRPRGAFCAGHVPGALGIELGESFAPWTGWLVPFDSPLLLVLDRDQDGSEAAVELGRIGFEQVLGVMRGTDRWAAEGRPLDSCVAATAADLAGRLGAEERPQILDVRDPLEWETGRVPGAVHRYVPDLVEGPPAGLDPAAPVWVVCRTGNRATIAAGLLERHGLEPVVVAEGGVAEVLAATGG